MQAEADAGDPKVPGDEGHQMAADQVRQLNVALDDDVILIYGVPRDNECRGGCSNS